nr:hypothetical protein EP46_21135 [Pantoea sp. 3.5.1]
MNDIGHLWPRGLIIEAQLQLPQALPHQAIKVVRWKVSPYVGRPFAQQFGHSITPVIKRQPAQAFTALLPGRFIPPAYQRGHAHVFIPAPASGAN